MVGETGSHIFGVETHMASDLALPSRRVRNLWVSQVRVCFACSFVAHRKWNLHAVKLERNRILSFGCYLVMVMVLHLYSAFSI